MQKLFKILITITLFLCVASGCKKKKSEESVTDGEITTEEGELEPQATVFKVLLNPENDTDPVLEYFNVFKATIEEKTEQNVLVELHTVSELKKKETVRSVIAAGDYDFAIMDQDDLVERSPWIAMFDSWFLFLDYDHYRQVAEDKVGVSMKQQIQDENGVKVLDVLFNDARVMVSSTPNSIFALADFERLNIGVAPSEFEIMQSQTLGANVRVTAKSEIYQKLFTNDIDTYETALQDIKDDRSYELASTIILTNHQFDISYLVCYGPRYNSLSDEYKEVMDEALKTLRESYDQGSLDKRNDDLIFLKDYGLTVQSVDHNEIHNAFSLFYRSHNEYTTVWNKEYYERILKIAKYRMMNQK